MCTHTILSPFSRRLTRGLCILLAVAVVAAMLPTMASAAAPQAKLDCDNTYEVRRGDSLNDIASLYGIAANQIVAANTWKKPYTIYVGQRICIPTSTQKNPPHVDNTIANAEAVYFTAGRTPTELLLYTYNYPETTVRIRVDDASDQVRKFFNVGEINITTAGNQRAWRFKLPADLVDASRLYVCLKDRSSDHVQCVYPRSGP